MSFTLEDVAHLLYAAQRDTWFPNPGSEDGQVMLGEVHACVLPINVRVFAGQPAHAKHNIVRQPLDNIVVRGEANNLCVRSGTPFPRTKLER